MSREWDLVGFVVSSTYRQYVISRLDESPSTTTEIADETGLATSHVSRTLRELVDRSIVTLAVPDDQHRNRIYELTDRGEKLWQRIREAGLNEPLTGD